MLSTFFTRAVSCRDTLSSGTCTPGSFLEVKKSNVTTIITTDNTLRYGPFAVRAVCNSDGDGFYIDISKLKPGKALNAPNDNDFGQDFLTKKPFKWQRIGDDIEFCLGAEQTFPNVHISKIGSQAVNNGSGLSQVTLQKFETGGSGPTGNKIVVPETGNYEVYFFGDGIQPGSDDSGSLKYSVYRNGIPTNFMTGEDTDDCNVCVGYLTATLNLTAGEELTIYVEETGDKNKIVQVAEFWIVKMVD